MHAPTGPPIGKSTIINISMHYDCVNRYCLKEWKVIAFQTTCKNTV